MIYIIVKEGDAVVPLGSGTRLIQRGERIYIEEVCDSDESWTLAGLYKGNDAATKAFVHVLGQIEMGKTVIYMPQEV